VQAVVGDEERAAGLELEAALELGLILELHAGAQRGAEPVGDAVGEAPARPALPGVEEAQRPFAGVHAVVGLVGDEHHARALRQVAVVGDVHEHPLHRVLLDPAVIDGDERVQADRGGVLGVEFDAELVQVHQSFSRQLCAASMKSWASSTSRWAASELGLFGGFSTALKKYWANLPPAKGSQKSFVSKNLS